MAESDTSASSFVRQTRQEYEEMRQKLAETEKKLNKLARLEARGQRVVVTSQNIPRGQADIDRNQSHQPPHLPLLSQRDAGDSSVLHGFPASLPSTSMDDLASVRSEVSTAPGSYTGFASQAFPASTPSRPPIVGIRHEKLAVPAIPEDTYDSDSSGSLRSQGSRNCNSNNSVKLLQQNQRLLTEVERLVCDLQAAKHREGELRLELEGLRSQMMDHRDKMEELKAETGAQDKARRSAEQHLTESQWKVGVVQQDLLACQRQVQGLRAELEEERRLRLSIEGQRDEAVQNVLDAQGALEDFQLQSQERIRKLEDSTDHLKDSLSHTNAERDDLLKQMDLLQKTVTTQKAEIERLHAQTALEQETKYDMEAQNLDLRRQLAKITTRLHKLEEDALQISVLREENAALRVEVDESRDLVAQLDELTDQLRRQRNLHHASQLSEMADDSGNFSIHQGTSLRASLMGKNSNNSHTQSESKGACVAEANTNNNGSTVTTVLAELRALLFEMDNEIRHLRSRLFSQEEEQRCICDLRSELNLLIDKAARGEEQTRELERVLGRLEADKTSMARSITQLQSEAENRETHIIAMDTRLSQRNSQIIELQEDVSKRCEVIANLEKELWKKSATISQLEALVEEKVDELKDTSAHLMQVQRKGAALEDEQAALLQKAKQQQVELEHLRVAEQQNLANHANQCRQYERQIDMIQKELERKDGHMRELQQQLQMATAEVADREQHIAQLETTLLELKEELGRASQIQQEELKHLEDSLSQRSAQVDHLESALLLCRSEITEHISSMEITRQKFDSELNKREQSIEHLESQLRSLRSEIHQRKEEVARLQRELGDKHSSLQQSAARAMQLQQSEASLKERLSQLESQLVREKGQWMMEADELERKLTSQSADLDTALSGISRLKQTIKELEDGNRQTEGERQALERALHNEQAMSQNNVARISRLEKELRDLRLELEQKIEIVGDLEDTLRNKDTDLQQQRSLVEQLDVDKVKMQRELRQLEEARGRLEELVQRMQFDLKAKEQILADTRDLLSKTQTELSEKTMEAGDLREAVKERQRELEDRVNTVQQLELTIHETHDEMSKRMARVDSTLHKYEAEIKERTRQIADLDDRLQQTQSELTETAMQLSHHQQLCQRQELELQVANTKLEELELTNNRHRTRLEEQRQENVEITQELRLTREQLQTQHSEFLAIRRELAAARRETEHLARELEEASVAKHSKDQDSARLSEELGASQAHLAQAEARLAAQAKQAHRDMAEMANRHKEELNALRRMKDEVAAEQLEAIEKIKLQAIQMAENERLYRQRLDSARAELEALHNELSTRKEVLRSANEALFSKDSEIARLKATVARFERHFGFSSSQMASSSGYNTQTALHSMDMASSQSHRLASSSQPYYLSSSSGPKTPLHRHDLNHNHAALNSSQNACQLPMKESWDDEDPEAPAIPDFTADRLVFSFERLGTGLVGAKDDPHSGGDLKVAAERLSLVLEKPDGISVESSDGSCGAVVERSSGVRFTDPPDQKINDSEDCSLGAGKQARPSSSKSAGDSGSKFSGSGMGSASLKTSYSSVSLPGKSHPRALSAPPGSIGRSVAQSHGPVRTRKTAKVVTLKSGHGGKVQGKKISASKDDTGDFRLLTRDPETLISRFETDKPGSQHQNEMENLQQQLQENALRQQEIERQLKSLDSSDSPTTSVNLIDLTAD